MAAWRRPGGRAGDPPLGEAVAPPVWWPPLAWKSFHPEGRGCPLRTEAPEELLLYPRSRPSVPGLTASCLPGQSSDWSPGFALGAVVCLQRCGKELERVGR